VGHASLVTVAWDLHYDRRVSAGFLSHFLPDGVARSLVEYARHAPFPVDLQMRHDPKASTEHASLYVDLTAVLNVRHKPGGTLALDAYKAHMTAGGFDPAWKSPKVAEAWSVNWRLVEDYLERIIPRRRPRTLARRERFRPQRRYSRATSGPWLTVRPRFISRLPR